MTTSRQKAKGSQFERDVVAVLRAHGHRHAERAMHFPDRGDIDGLPGFCLEAKDHARLALAEWMDEARSEAPEGVVPVVIAKRRGQPAARAYVVMELAAFADLAADRDAWRDYVKIRYV